MIKIGNKNYNLYIKNKLVFILILFAMLFINSKVYASTISFETYSGSLVSDVTKTINEEMGSLPVSTRSGYKFDGWYKESTYENKVSTKTIVTGDMTLHAKWIEDEFPFVYGPYRGEFTCDGTNYINTGVKLYNGDTDTEEGNWNKDYEIAFTIEEYDPDEQPFEQSVLVNTKYENASLKWPGLVFRKASNRLELTQSINMGQKVQKYTPTNIDLPYRVKILRISGKVYYEFNYGERSFLQNMSNFNQQFDIPTYFCAGDDGNGGIQRYAKAKISNYYIKLGTYQDDSVHTVTYPDGTVKGYSYNEETILDSNVSTKPDEVISTVTFKYHNQEEDTTSNVTKEYIPNGYMINGVHYDDEAILVVNENKVVTEYFNEEIEGATFPTNPTRTGYQFVGWYTEETGGTEYTSYNEDNNITLHAQWEKIMPTDITLDDNNIDLSIGETHQIGVTYIPLNSQDDLTFTSYDNNIISVTNEGLITAVSTGQTTITVGLQNVPNVTKTINVNVFSSNITSQSLNIETKNLAKIIVGEEPETTITSFLSKIDNPNENLIIYDKDNNLIDSLNYNSTIVTTGMRIKLVVGGTPYDEVRVIVRGDINEDGKVNTMDLSLITSHILNINRIQGYKIYASNLVDEGSTEEYMINILDQEKLVQYILEKIDSLN